MTVWKYQVPFHTFTVHYIPGMVKPLTVQYQDGVPCLWVEVRHQAESAEHRFRWFGTGHPIPDDALYVGTLQEGPFVWHLYEVRA